MWCGEGEPQWSGGWGSSWLGPAVAGGLGVWVSGGGDRNLGTEGQALVREMKTAVIGHLCVPWVGGVRGPR